VVVGEGEAVNLIEESCLLILFNSRYGDSISVIEAVNAKDADSLYRAVEADDLVRGSRHQKAAL